jgi:hypothetical protein
MLSALLGGFAIYTWGWRTAGGTSDEHGRAVAYVEEAFANSSMGAGVCDEKMGRLAH